MRKYVSTSVTDERRLVGQNLSDDGEFPYSIKAKGKVDIGYFQYALLIDLSLEISVSERARDSPSVSLPLAENEKPRGALRATGFQPASYFTKIPARR